jgi:hypothetical protein
MKMVKKIFVVILAICIVFSSCSKEISKLGELQKRDANTPSSPKDESSVKSTIQIPNEVAVIKLPNIATKDFPLESQIEYQGNACSLLGEEGIKANKGGTRLDIFYLNARDMHLFMFVLQNQIFRFQFAIIIKKMVS